jgi:hypothetical protein
VEKRRHRLPGIVIFVLVLFVPAALLAYVLHNLAWLVAVPIALFVLILSVAFVFGTLEKLFGIGRRKGTPEEFANALEKDLLGEEPERGWDEPMEVTLVDPRLEQVRRNLSLRPNLYRLATEKDKDELRAIIAALRRGDLPDAPPKSGIMGFFRFRK